MTSLPSGTLGSAGRQHSLLGLPKREASLLTLSARVWVTGHCQEPRLNFLHFSFISPQ